MNTSRRPLAALTGIRFFLAIWVVLYHQGDSLLQSIGGPPTLHRTLECFVRTGYSAVSAFFILSGFILTYNYDLEALSRPRNALRFGIARFSRIYPAYAVGLLLLIPFGIYRLAMGVNEGASTGTQFVLSALLLQAWLPTTALSWNYPGWSLSDEAFFYAALPVAGIWILWISKGRRASPVVLRLVVLAAALWGLSLVLPVFAILQPIPQFGDLPAMDTTLQGGGTWANLIRYDPLVRFPEFCIGVASALLYRLIPVESRLWNRGARLYLPAIAIILLVLANADLIPYPLVHNGLLAPAYALMIFGLALEGGVIVRFLSMPALVFLGGASYTMYILHVPVSAWMNILFLRVLHLSPHGMFWLICDVTAVVVFSALFFMTSEEPAHRWLRTRLNAWAESLHRNVPVPHT